MTVAVSMPMSVSEFDTGKQSTFRVATAAVTGVSNADVTIVTVEAAADASNANVAIVKVESIVGTRREGQILTSGRHLLTAGIRIGFSVIVATQDQVDALGAKLTTTGINAQLLLAGWSADTMLEAPKIPARAKGTSTTSSTTSGGGGGVRLLTIIMIFSGLVFLLGNAVFFYRYFLVKETTVTATCALSSAELGMCSLSVLAPRRSLSVPARTLPVVEAQMGTSSASANIFMRSLSVPTPTRLLSVPAPTLPAIVHLELCVDCVAMNEVSNEVCQHCRKQLHRENVAEQVTLYLLLVLDLLATELQ